MKFRYSITKNDTLIVENPLTKNEIKENIDLALQSVKEKLSTI